MSFLPFYTWCVSMVQGPFILEHSPRVILQIYNPTLSVHNEMIQSETHIPHL